MAILKIVLLVIGGYFLGHISTAKVISKIIKDDITKHGSGNPGTMNMLRTFGFKYGALTLLFDALKAAVPSLIGFYAFGGNPNSEIANVALYVGGSSAIIGHCFPVFYGFKGGKGVACMFGMFAVASPLMTFIGFVIAFLTLLFFEYGALASFVFLTALTVFEAIEHKNSLCIVLLVFLMYFFVMFLHRKNMLRLFHGKENTVDIASKLTKKMKKQLKKDNKIQKKEQKRLNKQGGESVEVDAEKKENNPLNNKIIETNDADVEIEVFEMEDESKTETETENK